MLKHNRISTYVSIFKHKMIILILFVFYTILLNCLTIYLLQMINYLTIENRLLTIVDC